MPELLLVLGLTDPLEDDLAGGRSCHPAETGRGVVVFAYLLAVRVHLGR